jgi:adenylate kinase
MPKGICVQSLIVICGQSGVGKTTVIEKVFEKRGDLRVLNFGERILAMALKRGLLRGAEDLEDLTPEVLSRLQVEASRHVHELNGVVLLDMHLTVDTPIGMIAGMPRTVMDNLQPSLIILLEAKPYDVLKRRMLGKGDLETEETVKGIQQRADIDRAAAVSIAIDLGIPIKILKSENADQTSEKILEMLGNAPAGTMEPHSPGVAGELPA